MNMRLVTAAAVLVSAAVHLYLWFDVFSGQAVIGPAFLLNAAGGLVIAVLLVRWRHWLPALLALGFGVSTLGAFVVAATVGLFGVHEHWIGWPVWTAAVSEVVAIVGGAVLLAGTLRADSRGQLQHPSAARGAHLH
ncbi:hypothetical protein KRR39_00040 [Nocardioides panacis]|uniref:Uncharacterized protein n=1 Tax=Nocardioides panacis TaxID=2849501 RepID=A0A975SZW6_9ACTN|nr:hypothetical protein [Nocardioides panacis]QWZ08304.1 hypothetical protein KRR39_23860 [Nocardioides panacis]QWZ08331.1 hypothetical protein KRR39_00040 [Nocardioides panacis]